MGHSSKTSNHTVEEAARWVARLQSSDANSQDREDFEKWVAGDPQHAAAYHEMSGLWQDLTGVTKETLKRRPRAAAGATLVAFVMAVVLGASLYQMGFIERWRADQYTVMGEVRQFTLEDGSVVTLDTDSAIRIDYGHGTRQIELLRGRAFFDVQKDPSRPFIVHEGSFDARALGTHYEVDTRNSGGVMVEEGRVSVSKGGSEAILTSGEMAVFGQDGSVSKVPADVANLVSWRNGKLIFSGQRLSDVLETLGRYRRGRIVTLGRGTADIRVSGVFDAQSPDRAIDVLEETLPVIVTRLTNYMIIVRARQ